MPPSVDLGYESGEFPPQDRNLAVELTSVHARRALVGQVGAVPRPRGAHANRSFAHSAPSLRVLRVTSSGRVTRRDQLTQPTIPPTRRRAPPTRIASIQAVR